MASPTRQATGHKSGAAHITVSQAPGSRAGGLRIPAKKGNLRSRAVSPLESDTLSNASSSSSNPTSPISPLSPQSPSLVFQSPSVRGRARSEADKTAKVATKASNTMRVPAPKKQARTPPPNSRSLNRSQGQGKTAAKGPSKLEAATLISPKAADKKDSGEKPQQTEQTSDVSALPHSVIVAPKKETILYDERTKTFYSKNEAIDLQELHEKLGTSREPTIQAIFEKSTLCPKVCDELGLLSNLQTLALRECIFLGKGDERMADITLAFLSTCPLRHLEISYVVARVHFTGLSEKGLGGLRVLDLRNTPLDAKFEHLLVLNELSILILRGSLDVTDASILPLAKQRNLQRLDLSGCMTLTPQGLLTFAQTRLQNITSKSVVPITCLVLENMRDKFSDASHLVFLRHMQGLKALSLKGSTDMLGTGLSHLPRTVRILDLRQCGNMRPDRLQEALEEHDLRAVNVNECQYIGANFIGKVKKARAVQGKAGDFVMSQEVNWLASEFEKLSLAPPKPVSPPPAQQDNSWCVLL